MNRRSIPKHRRKPLPQRRSAVSSNSVCIRNVPQRSAPSPRRRRPRPLLRGSDCARSQAAVPAVSMARRRIERLQGVQFCRRAMEIRSEVSGPPDCVRGAWTEKRGVCAPLDFWFGRAGVMGEGSGHFFHAFSSHSGSSPGGLCPHPPRNLRFLGFSFCCRRFELCSHQKRTAAVKRRSPAAQSASPSARQRLRAGSACLPAKMEDEIREVTSVRVALS